MKNDDFFNDKTMEDNQEIEKIKLGEKEYTQDELSKLVGLGEIAAEAEEKYNRPISKFWPEYTKQNQELEKIRQENEELRKVATNPRVQETLTEQEDIERKAKAELTKLGYTTIDVVEKRAREIASDVLSGYRLLDETQKTISKQVENGYPQVSADELLAFMSEKNQDDPLLAYKWKFEKEIDAIKEKKLASLKPSGLITESTSSAGSKQPAQVKITRKNLSDVLDEYLSPRNI